MNAIEWDIAAEEHFDINGGSGCGNIRLPKICRLIIDTPIFQRLRRIKQLGITELVFPNANHNRFIHSIGTCEFAFEEMKILKKYHSEMVDGADILCVGLAALCHDLGHGPYSHLFEDVFPSHFRHENMSVTLLNKLLTDYPQVKDGLSRYLNDEHFQLIEQLINPPDFKNIDSNWTLLVPREKAFLFAVVSNPLNGLDVDKFEYMLRDSNNSGVKLPFDKEIILRLISTARICPHLDKNFAWIAYHEKHGSEVASVFEARKRLHKIVYAHRVAVIADEMLKSSLRLAAPYLYYNGKNGKLLPLEKCFDDLDAYLQLDDSIYSRILTSPLPEMEQSKKLLLKIEQRQFPHIVAKFDDLEADVDPQQIKAGIEKILKTLQLSFDAAQMKVILKTFHAGKGNQNPFPFVLFYSRKNPSNTFISHSENLKCKSSIFIFGHYNCTEKDAKIIFDHLKTYAAKHNIHRPVDMFKNS